MTKISIFDVFKKKSSTKQESAAEEKYTYAPTSDNRRPFYRSAGSSLYASDIIVEAISCKANTFMKLDPRHIVEKDEKQRTIRTGSIADVLRRPTPYMTTADFLQKVAILLELNKNVFIYPTYREKDGKKYYTGLYPLKPSEVTYQVDSAGKFFIKFDFRNGTSYTLPREDVIHLRRDYYDDYFGGNSLFNMNAGIRSFLAEYNKLLQSIAKGVQVSCQIKGVLKVSGYGSNEAQLAAKQAFIDRLESDSTGIAVNDFGGEYTPIDKDVKIVDGDTLKFYHENICRFAGVSLPVLNGTANKQERIAFYEHSIEPFVIALSQAMTECMFTEREKQFGNKIICYPAAIEFMDFNDKINFINALAPGGSLTRDEMRKFGGLPPLPEGMGGDEIPRAYNSLDNASVNKSDKEDDEKDGDKDEDE